MRASEFRYIEHCKIDKRQSGGNYQNGEKYVRFKEGPVDQPSDRVLYGKITQVLDEQSIKDFADGLTALLNNRQQESQVLELLASTSIHPLTILSFSDEIRARKMGCDIVYNRTARAPFLKLAGRDNEASAVTNARAFGIRRWPALMRNEVMQMLKVAANHVNMHLDPSILDEHVKIGAIARPKFDAFCDNLQRHINDYRSKKMEKQDRIVNYVGMVGNAVVTLAAILLAECPPVALLVFSAGITAVNGATKYISNYCGVNSIDQVKKFKGVELAKASILSFEIAQSFFVQKAGRDEGFEFSEHHNERLWKVAKDVTVNTLMAPEQAKQKYAGRRVIIDTALAIGAGGATLHASGGGFRMNAEQGGGMSPALGIWVRTLIGMGQKVAGQNINTRHKQKLHALQLKYLGQYLIQMLIVQEMTNTEAISDDDHALILSCCGLPTADELNEMSWHAFDASIDQHLERVHQQRLLNAGCSELSNLPMQAQAMLLAHGSTIAHARVTQNDAAFSSPGVVGPNTGVTALSNCDNSAPAARPAAVPLSPTDQEVIRMRREWGHLPNGCPQGADNWREFDEP